MIDHGPLLLQYRVGGRLKVGLVTGGRTGPAWVRELIEWIESVPGVEMCRYAWRSEAAPRDAPPWLSGRLYELSRRKFDPFGEAAPNVDGERPVCAADSAGIRAAGLDLLIWLDEENWPEGSCGNLARLGALSVGLGEPGGNPPYWSEVLGRAEVSRASLNWHAGSFERARLLRTAELPTSPGLFFTRNAEACLAAVCRMLASTVAEISGDGVGWAGRERRKPEQEHPGPVARRYPSNLVAARFLARQALRSAAVRFEERGRPMRWFAGLRRSPELHYANLGRFAPEGIEEIPIEPGAGMADPFLAERNGKTWLFFEEIPPGSAKGRVSCMEVGKAPGRFSKPEVIMERDYHLSYPCVFEHAGEFFMIPECSRARSIELYRATRFPSEWRFETALMEDFAAVDTTPFFLDGRWYFFTTTTQPFMETLLFCSDSLAGKWRLHPSSPVSSSVRNSRSAGRLFQHAGRLLRPTQDCAIRYGYGMTINEIARLTPTEFEERAAGYIGPDWRRGLLATHTLNAQGTYEVVDGLRFGK